jgi:hypothetical protein
MICKTLLVNHGCLRQWVGASGAANADADCAELEGWTSKTMTSLPTHATPQLTTHNAHPLSTTDDLLYDRRTETTRSAYV